MRSRLLDAASAAFVLLAAIGPARADGALAPTPKSVIYPGDIIRDDMLTDLPRGGERDAGGPFVEDRSMVVGITDHQVTKLDDAEVEEIDLDEGTNWTVSRGPAGPTTAWKAMLEQMRNRTIRR